jgi:hypothetical protein
MDRLLRMAFEKLIRAGNLRVSTAGGSTFTLGGWDGETRGEPLHHACSRAVHLPETFR